MKNRNNVTDDIDNYVTTFKTILWQGSSAIYFNIWLKYPNKMFILNDNYDDLMKVYNLK